MPKKLVVFALNLIFSLSPYIVHCQENRQILLSPEEERFVKEHPLIHLGVDPKFVPFEFFDKDGEYKGITADMLDLISARTGLKFYIEKNLSWVEAYKRALRGELDGLPAVGSTREREENFILSKPYYQFKRVLALQSTDVKIKSFSDLEGLSVAVQKNSSHHSYLQDYGAISLSLYDTVEGALSAVASGEERAFLGNLATTNYLIQHSGITGLRLISFEADKNQALHFAARKDWPELASIFNKAIASISENEKNEIVKNWVNLDISLDLRPFFRFIFLLVIIFITVSAVSFFWISRLKKEIGRRKEAQEELERLNKNFDVTNIELKEANAKLEKISMLDGLTGIPNRRYFNNFLEKLWNINMREFFPVALIMIDIDDFKLFNDRFGHLVGDESLKKVAALIDQTVQRKGDFVARFGGEEFAVLLSNASEAKAYELAEKIRSTVNSASLKLDSGDLSISISLGIASMFSTKDINPDQLVDAADRALYRAKTTEKNKTVIFSSL